MTPDVLAFADRKTDGAYAVQEPSGAVVARIRVGFWSGSSFEAVTGSGEPLCTGRSRGVFSSTLEAFGPTAGSIAALKRGWGTSSTVTLPDERRLTLKGQLFGRDWTLRDAQGRDVLTSTPTTSSWSFHPDAWVVRSHDVSLDLAQVVAIVQLHRLMVKRSRSSSGGSAASS